ncbi:TonB-dependent receptor [Dyella sp. BiH032]|uniref:TonB-dependent receptor n=1 Tax=Dyella sp. BiH032 TaxID=3075430 RepID=UPI002893039C|nr:TonB-dependent receptor [Dyella sp. BiH032]WNL45842.1 TonB-dependent receptor [Dyella sp. BiH032]
MTITSFTAPRLRYSALALAMGLAFASTGALAQSNTTGSIFGQVAAQPGSTVVVENTETGFSRTVTVDESGRYRFSTLPVGKYKVTLQNNGSAVSTRNDIVVTISGGTEVSFGAAAAANDAKNLEGVSVVASALPAIDVSSVDTRTVLTSEQLNKLPIARSVGAAALLAPGVVDNSSYSTTGFGNIPSFGGAASSENAYYINGYAVTNPLQSLGSTTLPFDAIDQEQVLTGGYGAEFGRSTGGVINIVTKRGSNQWKAGVYAILRPEALRANPRNNYFPNTGFYGPNTAQHTDGTLYWYRNKNQYSYNTYGAYASGPLIKDKLFFYVDGEMTKQSGNSVASFSNSSAPTAKTGWNDYTYKMPRWTAKVDWNITDSNILELTGVQDNIVYDSSRYSFNYNNLSHGDVKTGGVHQKDASRLYIAKYTGYITDDLTVSALVGKQNIKHLQEPFGYDPSCPYISSTALVQAPGLTYGACQQGAVSSLLIPGANDKTHGWRLDVEYRLGDHDLRAGVDDQTAQSLTGQSYPGGYAWVYGWQANPNVAIDANGTGTPASGGGLGTKGYFVSRAYNTQNAKVKTEQQAQFIEDRWQITDRWLLSIGLRNEQFTNYNGDGKPYARQRHQLAPRIGAAWDVFGDSSLKLYANAGRYHLAMPNNVAVRGASGSLITNEYFTYTGVDPKTGAPTGLTPIAVDRSLGHACGNTNAVSTNLECGTAPDPRTVAAKGLKSHYQDEYIAGMEQQVSPTFNWGAKLTYRKLRSAIDDTCAQALGGSCFLFNPGETNTFLQAQDDGSYKEVTYTRQQLGLPELKRKYYALDLFLEHPFADKWYGRVDYTFSRNYGNTEGQLASDLDTGNGGQADVSTTQDWDLPQLMVGSNGLLPNNRKHQIKAYGYFQATEEWRFGATLVAASGRPKNCTSHYPTADAGLYSGAAYWFCGLSGSGTKPGQLDSKGKPITYVPAAADYAFSPRGSHGTAPWTYQLNLNVAYQPAWLKDFTLQLDVINVLNRQVATAYNYRYETSARNTPNQLYLRELNVSDPRYFRITARYDF